jgi:hypothetical protein
MRKNKNGTYNQLTKDIANKYEIQFIDNNSLSYKRNINFIGNGNFGEVYQALWKIGNLNVVVKEFFTKI